MSTDTADRESAARWLGYRNWADLAKARDLLNGEQVAKCFARRRTQVSA